MLRNKVLVFLPKSVYNHFLIKKQLNALAFYIQLKKKYKNSIILNATNKRLATLASISESRARVFKNVLIESGLCEYNQSANTLLLRNPSKLKQYFALGHVNRMSYFQIMANYKDQVKHLKGFPILCNILHQQNEVSKRLKPIKNYAEKRRVANKAKKHVSYNENRITLGVNKITNILNCSRITAQRRKKELRKLKVCSIIPNFEKTEITPKQLKELRANFYFLPISGVNLCQNYVRTLKVFTNYLGVQYVASQTSCNFRVDKLIIA